MPAAGEGEREAGIDREKLLWEIAAEIDRPSVHMGGPSRSALRKAEAIMGWVDAALAVRVPEGEKPYRCPDCGFLSAHSEWCPFCKASRDMERVRVPEQEAEKST